MSVDSQCYHRWIFEMKKTRKSNIKIECINLQLVQRVVCTIAIRLSTMSGIIRFNTRNDNKTKNKTWLRTIDGSGCHVIVARRRVRSLSAASTSWHTKQRLLLNRKNEMQHVCAYVALTTNLFLDICRRRWWCIRWSNRCKWRSWLLNGLLSRLLNRLSCKSRQIVARFLFRYYDDDKT